MTPSIQELIMGANMLLSRLPVIIIGFAVVYFFWKLVQGIQSDSGKKRAEIRGLIGYGILALFVMMFVWGIIVTFQKTLFPGGFIQTLGK
jgi:hypothetical protein